MLRTIRLGDDRDPDLDLDLDPDLSILHILRARLGRDLRFP